jgi:hypothetical protein
MIEVNSKQQLREKILEKVLYMLLKKIILGLSLCKSCR